MEEIGSVSTETLMTRIQRDQNQARGTVIHLKNLKEGIIKTGFLAMTWKGEFFEASIPWVEKHGEKGREGMCLVS